MVENLRKKMFLINLPHYLGILADGLWGAMLLYPPLYAYVLEDAEFHPNLKVKLLMGIGGILMLGWTLLLIWVLRKPIERRELPQFILIYFILHKFNYIFTKLKDKGN